MSNRSPRILALSLSCLLAVAGLACGEPAADSDPAVGESTNPATGAVVDGEDLACKSLLSITPDNPGPGVVRGTITATGETADIAAIGDIYISVAEGFDPADPAAFPPVAAVVVQGVDLTAGGSAEFVIEGLPVREESYSVVPFMDTNLNVDACDESTAGPDGCDYLNLPGSATVTEAAPEASVSLDLAFVGSDIIALGFGDAIRPCP